MPSSHLNALNEKLEKLERDIHHESTHAARNDLLIEKMKKERLLLKEEIERSEKKQKQS